MLWLLAALINAAIFGNVSSIMLRLMASSEEFHEKQTSVGEFIKFHRIPKNLANRCAAAPRRPPAHCSSV